MPDYSQILTLLFLMLGPFKILGPFANITKDADPVFARKVALRAILYSLVALFLAAVLGERILVANAIPVPILALSGGIILFLVALLRIIRQFEPTKTPEDAAVNVTMEAAMYPLAFPTIVTPYGIAAVIVFTVLSPDLHGKLIVASIVTGIMMLNLIIMLFSRQLFKPFSIFLAILGAILGIIQVAIGAKIIYNNLTVLLTS